MRAQTGGKLHKYHPVHVQPLRRQHSNHRRRTTHNPVRIITVAHHSDMSLCHSWFNIPAGECKIFKCRVVWEEVGGGYEKDNIEIKGQWWDWEGTSSRFNYNCNGGTHRHNTRQSPRHTLHVLVPPAVCIRRHWDRHRHDGHPQINTRRPSAVGRSWALGRRKFNGETIIRLLMIPGYIVFLCKEKRR